MAFDPIEWTEVSKNLASNLDLPKDARCRTAAGRAYYSLFIATRTAVNAAGARAADTKIDHGALSGVILRTATSHKRADLEALGTLLGELYDARFHADYKQLPDARWDSKFSKPAFAKSLADKAANGIRSLHKIDFTAVAALL